MQKVSISTVPQRKAQYGDNVATLALAEIREDAPTEFYVITDTGDDLVYETKIITDRKTALSRFREIAESGSTTLRCYRCSTETPMRDVTEDLVNDMFDEVVDADTDPEAWWILPIVDVYVDTDRARLERLQDIEDDRLHVAAYSGAL